MSKRISLTILWASVLVGTLGLAYQRYHGAVAMIGYDFQHYYLPAAQALAEGGNPYDQDGYVYSPIVALLLEPFAGVDVTRQFQLWSAAMVALLLLSAATTAYWPRLAGWRRPVLVGTAVASTLHFWPTTIALFLGQADPLVLALLSAAVLASTHRRSVAAAVLLGLCGAVKTWPMLFGVGLLGRRSRTGTVAACLLAGAVGPLLALLLGGPGWVKAMVTNTQAAADQLLISHSILGFTEQMFSKSGIAAPWIVSPALRVAVAVVLFSVLLGSLVVLARRGADEPTRIVHAAAATVLVIPVSHVDYTMFVLPLLWWAAAEVLRQPSPRAVVLAVVMLAWWVVAEQAWPDIGASASLPAIKYAAVFLSNYVAVVTSCWLITSERAATLAGSGFGRTPPGGSLQAAR